MLLPQQFGIGVFAQAFVAVSKKSSVHALLSEHVATGVSVAALGDVVSVGATSVSGVVCVGVVVAFSGLVVPAAAPVAGDTGAVASGVLKTLV